MTDVSFLVVTLLGATLVWVTMRAGLRWYDVSRSAADQVRAGRLRERLRRHHRPPVG